jgi:N-acetylmuramoyl-L-alanine amidase
VWIGRLVVVCAATLAAIAACGGGGEAASSTTTSTSVTTTSTTTSTSTTSTSTTSTSTTSTSTTTTEPGDPNPLDGRIVVVDPGHNGANGQHPDQVNVLVDAGGFEKACNTTGTATDDGYSESRFNLEVALLVRDRLAALGAEVRLTRDDDDGWGPCIDQRGLAATGADVLVSIHADGSDPGDRGFHVIHPAPLAGFTDATAAASADLAGVLRVALVDAGFEPSTYLGVDGLDERGDLGTLNRSPAPAAIVESGNMRNVGDAAILTSPDGQQRLADALVEGVRRFLAG